MSGIYTNQRFAILDTTRGLNLDTFATMQDLAQQACYHVWSDFAAPSSDPNADEKNGPHFEGVYARHVAWIRSIADEYEKLHNEQIERDKNPEPNDEECD